MFMTIKIGGIWQMWNVTCDRSIIVENGHRNMGFFRRPIGRKAKTIVHALKSVKPSFSLSTDSSKVVIDSDLQRDPCGFHVFDYAQLRAAAIDINAYFQVSDFRLGSFVVFKGNIFTAERIADELDTYPGCPFLTRHLRGQEPAPIEPTQSFRIVIPSREDAKSKILETAWDSWCKDCKQSDQDKLEELENYMDTYCYPDLDLKIPRRKHGKSEEGDK